MRDAGSRLTLLPDVVCLLFWHEGRKISATVEESQHYHRTAFDTIKNQEIRISSKRPKPNFTCIWESGFWPKFRMRCQKFQSSLNCVAESVCGKNIRIGEM